MVRAPPVAVGLLSALPGFAGAQEKYPASYAGLAGFQALLWMAKDFGFLAKYGVDKKLLRILRSRCLGIARRQRPVRPDRRHGADHGNRHACIRHVDERLKTR